MNHRGYYYYKFFVGKPVAEIADPGCLLNRQWCSRQNGSNLLI